MRLRATLLTLCSLPVTLMHAVAQTPTIDCGDGVLIGCNTTGEVSTPASGQLTGLIATTASTIITIFAVLAVVFVIYGGIKLIFSLGNDEKMRAAVRTILYALAGLVLAVLAFAIVSVVSNIRIF